MKLDIYGNPIFNGNDLFQALYQNKNIVDNNIIVEGSDEISQLMEIEPSISYSGIDESMPIHMIDQYNQSSWFIPIEYQNMDILDYCLSQCSNDAEIERVAEEYIAFDEYGLINVLKWVKYFVDTCNSNNVLWGIGRGSSVSSFLLYKLGLHKVDSLKYNLDWTEFLRKEEN